MNKKGKNKKGKVPNPSPLQEEKSGNKVEKMGKSDNIIEDVVTCDKKDEIGMGDDNIQNLKEVAESVKEERVPVIVSGIITNPVVAKDEETPKKPKRNRGKKKKGKEDDFDDNPDEKSKDTDVQLLEETKVDIPKVETKLGELPMITPTARRKKNKHKDTEQSEADPILLEQESGNVSKVIAVKEPEIIESAPEVKEVSDFLKTEFTELDVKSPKKKNKKKTRNDSDRSDKEEFSCTANFQKILDDKDAVLGTEIEVKVEDSIIALKSVKAEVENVNIELEQNKENVLKPVIEKENTPIEDEEIIKDILITESKGKKKHKKDKKYFPKSEESSKQDETTTEQIPTLLDTETPAQSLIPKLMTLSYKSQEELTKDVVVTETSQQSTKSKANIAKPVEKKCKGKHDAQTLESTPQDTSIFELSKIQDKPSVQHETHESKIIDQEKVYSIESEITQPEKSSDISFVTAHTTDEDTLTAQEFELIAEKAMGKKRRKGPKMSKKFEIDIAIQEQKMEVDTKQTDTKDDIKIEQLPDITEILTPQVDQQEFKIMSEQLNIPITNIVTESKDTLIPLGKTVQGKVLLTPEGLVEEIGFAKIQEIASQKADNKQKTEIKPVKNRKKSPKPPIKSEVLTDMQDKAITSKPVEIGKVLSKNEELPKQSLAEKIDASNITKIYDIEISSVKANELEGSLCDVIPDVTYPRATSQQLPDDNNNTVIREIFPFEETIPATPIVHGFTETPKMENINKVPESVGIVPKEEKTDLKSKMMEVNQDMEELRLSIERSLAELTSIEKSEDAIEKEFETTRLKAKIVSNLLYETDDSAKILNPELIDKDIEKSIEVESVKDKALDELKITSDIDHHSDKQKMTEKSQDPVECSQTIAGQGKKHETKDKEKIQASEIESKNKATMSSIEMKCTESPTMKDEQLVKTPFGDIILSDSKPLLENEVIESTITPKPFPPIQKKKTDTTDAERQNLGAIPKEKNIESLGVPPVCPARKEHKGKHKKKKGTQETQITSITQSTTTATQSQIKQEIKKEEKTDAKTEGKSDSKAKSESKEKGKQQSMTSDTINEEKTSSDMEYEPIEKFEDALTSSADDVNKTFEMIVKESQDQNNPKINVIAPDEEKTPVSLPKNLLGHPDIPVRSNRRDYKKEKDKIPNDITAKVKIKDAVDVDRKQSKNTQTISKMKEFSKDYKINDNEDYVYKYSFRKVFLQSSCHVCKKYLSGFRVPCSYCNLLFYCSNKHKDEDWPQHQALCFAISTIVHLKDQKHIYADARNLTGQDYRLIRMQMIVSCEKVLKRRLVPWEQEALLYPRVCAHLPCREWRQEKLSDCQGCGQISYCSGNADHFPKSHSRWCKSYFLYEKLVCYQQTKGRLEPKLPTKVLQEQQQLPEKINEVLASMYEEKVDINDIQYAALTQLATAPLTAAYCHQLYRDKICSPANGGVFKKATFTIHVVGAELQFEADALNKWEVFFLHLRPDLQELRVVLINYNLNPSNLPLELLGKIKLCENCRQNKRRVVFNFQDKRTYSEYKSSEDFVHPDIVCAFNPSIQRSSVYNGKDPWPSTSNIILKLKIPFVITAYTITELQKDCIRIKECSESGYNFIAEPKYNNFASVRPDRNFISDDEMPLLFKNYCFAIISG